MNTKIIMKLNSNKVIVSSLNQIKHLSRQKRICQPRAFAVIGFLLLMAFSGSLFAQTLIGHWTFANQTLANTGTTGATNDGAYYVQGTASTPVFSANIPPGMSGYSLDLTAAGAFMAVSNSGSSDSQYNGAFDNGSFTVALWEKRPNSAWQYDAWNVFADKTDGGSVGFFLRRQGVGNNPFADVYPTDPGISSSQNINDGSWHHLAITYSAGVLTLYVDGVTAGTGSGTFTPDAAAKLIFGAQDNSGYRSSGALLSDLRFYNYALTASQVFALLPPPPPTPALIGHWTFADQTLANSGTTGSTNDGICYVSGTASAPVFSTNVPPGMSGYSLDLTTQGSFMAVSNSAFGDASYVSAFDNSSFTVALWEKRPNSAWQYDAWNVFADKTDGASAGFFLRRQGVGNNPFADVYPTDPGISSSQNINDGSWHHLAITYSSGVLTLYVDGVATVTGSGTFTPDTAAKLIFGAQDNTGYRSSGALLSDLRFYNYALTASQVFALLPPPTPALIGHWTFANQTLANSGATGTTNDGICYVSGTASAPVFSTDVPPGMSGNSLDLTTQGSFMAVSNSASGDASYVRAFDYPAFTVALWENRPNSAWQYDAWNVFADKTDGGSVGFFLRRQGVGNNPFADVYPTDPGISSSQNINDGSWHHLAITYSAGVLTLYVDGVTAGTGSGTFTPDAAAKLIFGAQDNSGYRSSGALLSDLRFYNYALTASQVSELTLAPGLPTVSNPNSLEIYQGLNATFSAVALGNPEPTVQWYRNGNPISGATSPTLTITNVGIAQQASYTIVAANSFGSVTSSPAILTIINPPGNGTYASAILAQNPMGYWRFSDGGGTNAYDYVGGNNAYDTNYMNNGNGSTGNPATLGAGPQPSTFPGFETTNTAPFLDGLSQGYSSSVGLFNNRSNFTIMGWFNLDPSQYPIAADPFIHPDGRASLFGQEWASEIGIYQGTNLYFYATGISATIFANTNLVPGVWNFVAAVSDATANTTTLYLNGAVVGTALACPGTVNPYLFSIGKNVAYFPSGGYDNAFFPGSLDEVAAFDHPLSLSQIQALYQTAVALANVPPTNVVAKVASISGTNNLILTGAGGSGSSYTVLTTTNLTTPLANWSTNATGLPFGAGGSVNYTNPINPATPKLFYRIRVP